MSRIGVFICHCGLNIAGTIDVEKVVKLVSDYPEVVYATDYMYMCSDIANVDEEVCVGCGACSAACLSGAMQQNNFSKRQIFEMVDTFTI